MLKGRGGIGKLWEFGAAWGWELFGKSQSRSPNTMGREETRPIAL